VKNSPCATHLLKNCDNYDDKILVDSFKTLVDCNKSLMQFCILDMKLFCFLHQQRQAEMNKSWKITH